MRGLVHTRASELYIPNYNCVVKSRFSGPLDRKFRREDLSILARLGNASLSGTSLRVFSRNEVLNNSDTPLKNSAPDHVSSEPTDTVVSTSDHFAAGIREEAPLSARSAGIAN